VFFFFFFYDYRISFGNIYHIDTIRVVFRRRSLTQYQNNIEFDTNKNYNNTGSINQHKTLEEEH